MVQYPHLRHAPITEALLDFRVRPGLDHVPIDKIKDHVGNEYSIVRARKLAQSEIEVGPERMSQTLIDHGVQGYWFYNQDKTRIAQFRVDGFTYNMLKPYTHWDDMRDRALALWRVYEETMAPEAVVRVATRFINHLDIPSLAEKDYLNSIPTVPEGYPGEVIGFITRLTVQGDDEIKALVTQSLLKRDGDTFTILLDIDAFRETDDLTVPLIEEEIQPILTKLRRFKNDFFFSSITQKTRDLYR